MSLIFPFNLASKKVALKLGLQRVDDVEVFGEVAERHMINAEAWRALAHA